MIGGNLPALTEVRCSCYHRTAQPVSRIAVLLNWRTCRDGEFATASRYNRAVVVSAGLTLGTERYRYPNDLPKVAAKGRPYCKELGLPNVPPSSECRPSSPMSARTCHTGIRASAELRRSQELVVRADTRDRRATPHRSECRDDTRDGHAHQVHGLRARDGDLTAFLFFIFSQTTTGKTNEYAAVFTDASRLKTGDTVRVAGIRVGTVKEVSLQPDRKVLVKFDAGRDIVLTTGTKAQIRYLNLTGDRFLELADSPGSTKILPVGSQIPVDRTAPALDLDLLLGGLKPVIQGLNRKT